MNDASQRGIVALEKDRHRYSATFVIEGETLEVSTGTARLAITFDGTKSPADAALDALLALISQNPDTPSILLDG